MDAAQAQRLATKMRSIHGWLSPGAVALFALIDEVQRREGISGDLFEIGVHHGKSAVLLCLMAGPGERIGVCDLFGSHEKNTSNSGFGDRQIFESNVARYAPGIDRLEIFEKSSYDLTEQEVGGMIRIFHVDGGHLLEEALSDLKLGAKVLHDHGVIVVDDPFRIEWPGVTEAIIRFLEENRDYAALVAGFNKLVLARKDALAPYEKALAAPWDYFPDDVFSVKKLPFAGHDLTIFFVPTSRQMPGLDGLIARAARIRSAGASALGMMRGRRA